MGSLVTINLKLQYGMKRDGDVWVARCYPLDIVTQSNSEDGARGALREAIDLWFESCLERGVLDSALREAGFVTLVEGKMPSPEGGAEGVHGAEQARGAVSAADQPLPDYMEVSIPAYIADQIEAQTGATR